jgi:hypothetical protein
VRLIASNEAGDSATTTCPLRLPPTRPVTSCYLPPATGSLCHHFLLARLTSNEARDPLLPARLTLPPPHAHQLASNEARPAATCLLRDSLCHHLLLTQLPSNEAGDFATTSCTLGSPPMRSVTRCYLPPARLASNEAWDSPPPTRVTHLQQGP